MYYNSFNDAMKKRFGCKVYKLSLDGGFTCPTRDGALGSRGCIFCSGSGSGDFADPYDQIENAKSRVASKIRDGKFIAYFQNHTNTYASVDRLKEIFGPVIQRPDIAALDIATRPDCLEPEKIELLSELCRIKPVWVELGLQTADPVTAGYIRRGFDLPVYDDAVKRLHESGLEVITHMIIGLPGETEREIYNTAEHISSVRSEGIKLQLLHVLKGTDLYEDYRKGGFRTLEMGEYIELLKGCIRRIRPEIIVHRLTGDGAKKDLAAPLWSADKKKVLNAIRREFIRDDVVQGELAL